MYKKNQILFSVVFTLALCSMSLNATIPEFQFKLQEQPVRLAQRSVFFRPSEAGKAPIKPDADFNNRIPGDGRAFVTGVREDANVINPDLKEALYKYFLQNIFLNQIDQDGRQLPLDYFNDMNESFIENDVDNIQNSIFPTPNPQSPKKIRQTFSPKSSDDYAFDPNWYTNDSDRPLGVPIGIWAEETRKEFNDEEQEIAYRRAALMHQEAMQELDSDKPRGERFSESGQPWEGYLQDQQNSLEYGFAVGKAGPKAGAILTTTNPYVEADLNGKRPEITTRSALKGARAMLKNNKISALSELKKKLEYNRLKKDWDVVLGIDQKHLVYPEQDPGLKNFEPEEEQQELSSEV